MRVALGSGDCDGQVHVNWIPPFPFLDKEEGSSF